MILTKVGTGIITSLEIKELQTNREELARQITAAVLERLKNH